MRATAKRLALLTQGLFAVLALPPEFVTFEKIADEFRVPIATKIRDMRTNYGLQELAPARTWAFVDDDGDPQLTIQRSVILSPARDSCHETVQFISFGTVLYAETIDTRGKNLTETDLEQRLLFDSTSGYGLQSDPTSGLDETEKTIRISVGNAPVLAYSLSRTDAQKTHTTVINMSVGSKSVAKIVDQITDDPVLRTYTYQMISDSFIVRMLTNAQEVTGIPVSGSYQVRVEKPPGYALPQTSFRVNGSWYYSLDGFLNEFNPDVYEKLVSDGTLPVLNDHINSEFPATERRANPALGGKLLEELSQIFTKLQTPSLNPADQILIRNKILGYMDAVREGSITDTRKPKPGAR